MKFLAFILTITVVFLAVKPGVSAFMAHCEQEISCCASACEPFALGDQGKQDEPSKNQCTGNACNPFQSCSMSIVLTLNELEPASFNPEVNTEDNFNYQFSLATQFATDFWQPPKIV